MAHEPQSTPSPESGDHGTDRDALTGLPGRAGLRERFNAATAVAQRDGKRLAILFLDLDRFKEVNDELSYSVGDAALRRVAECLDESVGSPGAVSRHGGDEFVILLTGLSRPTDAARVAETLLRSLMAPQRIGEHEVRLSASIGISLYPDDGLELEELIHCADAAMYQTKRQRPGSYRFHGADQLPGDDRPPPAAQPDATHPHAMARERRRQGQLQDANEQLLLAVMAAREMQSAAERALGEQTALLARVAHELRNPLTPISMAASLLERADALELPRLRAVIERQVEHVSRLVGDLLDLSRAQAGKLRLQRSVVDVCGLIAEVLESCRPAMEARRQHLVVDLREQPLLVDGDRVRLDQVLSNLIDNASKYTPAEGAVTVSASSTGADVVISVSDTGIGIGADAIASVFEPFVQDSRATNFNGEGLGIGLTVVRELAEAHGGKVQAFSAGEGRGSEFVLTLPRHGTVAVTAE